MKCAPAKSDRAVCNNVWKITRSRLGPRGRRFVRCDVQDCCAMDILDRREVAEFRLPILLLPLVVDCFFVRLYELLRW